VVEFDLVHRMDSYHYYQIGRNKKR